MEKIEAFKCGICGEIHNREENALQCELKHIQNNLANCMLQQGYTLDTINYWCKFGWSLKDEQKGITKESCFIIEHWQCCDKPAYQIKSIDNGWLNIRGCGSWSGYYGNLMSVDHLSRFKPHPKEELFIDPRYGK
jgi:hypothetical protein